jgi:hypothetical protein
VARDGLNITVTEEANPLGVRISASGGPGVATVTACDTEIELTDGDEIIVVCPASLEVQVLAGSVEILLDENAVATVPTGGTVLVSDLGDGRFEVENHSPPGTPPIVIVADGQTVELAPGESLTVGGPIVVDLDIKPGSCPNSFNRSSNGVLPVGLLGAAGFDITQVDPSSVVIARADGVGGFATPNEGPPGPHSVLEDVGTPFDGASWDCHELEGDGILDLSMKFKTQDVVTALGLDALPDGALVELAVSGLLTDGTPFTASDCVRLVPTGAPPGGRCGLGWELALTMSLLTILRQRRWHGPDA